MDSNQLTRKSPNLQSGYTSPAVQHTLIHINKKRCFVSYNKLLKLEDRVGFEPTRLSRRFCRPPYSATLPPTPGNFYNGGAYRDRTDGLLLAKQMLFQLS